MARLNHRQIDRYDGQTIVIGNQVAYELGNYLGGGASGSVYQALDMSSQSNNEKSVAIKILNPLGFKILSYGQLSKCIVASKGQPLNQKQIHGKVPLTTENIWWLVHPSSEQVFAAYEDVSRGQLRELTLPRCIEVWGWTPLGSDHLSVEVLEKMNISGQSIVVSNTSIVQLPIVPPKYLKWLQSRATICREMKNMIHIGEHSNIVALLEVLELIQDSKAVLFLVLEFVNGGELFDRMKRNNGPGTSSDEFARRYFSQLLSGIDYCHGKGVVHRDLKPENLLLSDPSDTAILKIADFGLSAVVFAREGVEGGYIAVDGNEELSDSRKQQQKVQYGQLPSPIEIFQTSPAGPRQQHHYSSPPGTTFPVPLRRLRSVVGSPHYIAPEIVNHDPCGYDGRKVDMWSAGVILYSMLTGSLPFGGDLPSCPRYKRYKQWMQLEYGPAMREGKGNEIVLPLWFFVSSISSLAGSLIVSLLHIDPQQRCTAAEALRHPWSTMEGSDGNISSGEILYSNSSGQLKGVKGVKLFQSDEMADNYQQNNSSFSSTSSTSSQRNDKDKLKSSKSLNKDHKDKRLNSIRRPKSPPSPSTISLNNRPQTSHRATKINSAFSRSRSPEDKVEGDILKVLTSMSSVLSLSEQNPLEVTDLSTPNEILCINEDKKQPQSGLVRESSVPIISIESNIPPYGCDDSILSSLPVPPSIESVHSLSRIFPADQSSSGKRFPSHDYEEEEQRERYRCTLEQRQREKTNLLTNLQKNSKGHSITNSLVPTNFISVDNEYDDAINEIHFK